jgi:hypothetical protein
VKRGDGAPASQAPETPLLDLPLSTGADDLFAALPAGAAGKNAQPDSGAAARMVSRARAFAADAATILLLVAAAMLSATALRGAALSAAAFGWAAVFALYLSFFATVLPLTLFGRTLGMAVADLTARPAGSPRLRSSEGIQRWIGTVATAAALGIPILFTVRDPAAPTPADRFSGRPLVESDAPDRS